MSTVVFDQTFVIHPLTTPGDNTSCWLLFLHQSAWRTLQWDEMRVMRVKPASCVSHAVRSRLDSHHTLFSHGHIKKAVKLLLSEVLRGFPWHIRTIHLPLRDKLCLRFWDIPEKPLVYFLCLRSETLWPPTTSIFVNLFHDGLHFYMISLNRIFMNSV